jgi:hypothetical protein
MIFVRGSDSGLNRTLVGRLANKLASHGRRPSAMDLRVPDYGKRAGRKQATQIAIASFADAAELVPA